MHFKEYKIHAHIFILGTHLFWSQHHGKYFVSGQVPRHVFRVLRVRGASPSSSVARINDCRFIAVFKVEVCTWSLVEHHFSAGWRSCHLRNSCLTFSNDRCHSLYSFVLSQTNFPETWKEILFLAHCLLCNLECILYHLSQFFVYCEKYKRSIFSSFDLTFFWVFFFGGGGHCLASCHCPTKMYLFFFQFKWVNNEFSNQDLLGGKGKNGFFFCIPTKCWTVLSEKGFPLASKPVYYINDDKKGPALKVWRKIIEKNSSIYIIIWQTQNKWVWHRYIKREVIDVTEHFSALETKRQKFCFDTVLLNGEKVRVDFHMTLRKVLQAVSLFKAFCCRLTAYKCSSLAWLLLKYYCSILIRFFWGLKSLWLLFNEWPQTSLSFTCFHDKTTTTVKWH